VTRFKKAETAKEAKAALERIRRYAQSWMEKFKGETPNYGAEVKILIDEVDKELTEHWDHWIDIEQKIREIREDDVELIGELRRKAYDPELGGQSVSSKLEVLRLLNLGRISKYYNFHMRDENRITAEFEMPEKKGEENEGNDEEREDIAHYIEEYEWIKDLLSNPEEVHKYLDPLNDAIGWTTRTPYKRLKELLREHEKGFGFSPIRLIPLGVLPPEKFLQIVGRGIQFEDIGAGVGHGPLTHRLQWYAITSMWKEGKHEWKHCPYDLYTRLGHEPFTAGRLSQTSLWAILGDKPNIGRDYKHPMMLHGDLLGKPEFKYGQKVKFGKVKIRNIQRALLKHAQKTWAQYPRGRGETDEPTEEMIKQYIEEFEKAGFEIQEKGEGEYSGRKRHYYVLVHKDDLGEYEEK